MKFKDVYLERRIYSSQYPTVLESLSESCCIIMNSPGLSPLLYHKYMDQEFITIRCRARESNIKEKDRVYLLSNDERRRLLREIRSGG
jgi:hypothetical protein